MKNNFRDKAYYKVSRNPNLFEREINECLAELEENLEHREIIKILTEYVNENDLDLTSTQNKNLIENSGHGELIKKFYQ